MFLFSPGARYHRKSIDGRKGRVAISTGIAGPAGFGSFLELAACIVSGNVSYDPVKLTNEVVSFDIRPKTSRPSVAHHRRLETWGRAIRTKELAAIAPVV
jgi:hypothetical protein